MRGTLVVARREAAGLAQAPFAWMLLLVVLFLNGFLFNAILRGSGGNVTETLDQVMTGGLFWLWMIFLPPLLCMRLVAEETRTGTLEYLLTAPVSDAAVVTGKFLAAIGFLGLLWSSALVYAAALDWVGGAPDWPAVVGTWIGTLLVSGVFVGIGMLASTLTGVPLLAAFLAFVASVLWLALPFLGTLAASVLVPLLTDTAAAAEAWNERIEGLLANMDAMRHFQRSFKLGVIDTAELVFFLTWTAFFLFLTTRALEARRWRG